MNRIQSLLLNIKEESNAYQKTKFTDLEKAKADELLIIINKIESTNFKNKEVNIKYTHEALGLLSELSAIQIDESKQIMDYAEKLYLSGKTSSQFVFAIIIVILLVLQALVFTSKSLFLKIRTKDAGLN